MKTLVSKSLFAAAIVAALPACSTFQPHTTASIPVETISVSAKATESGDKLYVAGSVPQSRGRSTHRAAHVDVQLLDAQGRVVAERRDNIDASHPRLTQSRHRRGSFVASFPLSEARGATKVRVVYHTDRHIQPS